MKKIIALFLIVALVLSFSCCRKQSSDEPDFNEEVKTTSVPQTTEPIVTEPTTQYKTVISAEVLATATCSYRYKIYDSGFSITVDDVLNRCCDDFDADYSPYYEAKQDLSDEIINQVENGNYKQYLNNSYIINIKGYILYNPEIPHYYTDYQEIITLLFHFDDNDNLVGSGLLYASEEFHNCAVLLSVGSVF